MTTNPPFELNQTPGVWTSLRQQLWLLGSSRRWTALTLSLAAVMAIIDVHVLPPVPSNLWLVIVLLPITGLWVTLVWSGEGPSQRGYHWSLPVPRAAHDLARVVAGAVYLVALCAVLAAVAGVLAASGGYFNAFAAIDAEAWANFFLAPLVVYLLVSPLVLWRDYAVVRWLMGALFALGVLTPLAETQHVHVLSDAWKFLFFSPDVGLGLIANGTLQALAVAIGDADLGPSQSWVAAVALWLGIGAVLTVLAATFRPDDLTRTFRRTAEER